MSRLIASKTIGQVATSSGGGAGSAEITASGALANGDTVVINSNGTVSAVTGSTSVVSGSAVNYDTGIHATYTHVCYDEGQDKILVIYKDQNNSYYGTAVVGTISGTAISFGTPVVFYSNSLQVAGGIGMAYHPTSQKIFILHATSSSHNRLTVATISGTSVSFTTTNAPFSTSETTYALKLIVDSNSGNLVAMGVLSYLRYCVGSVSGSTVTWQSQVSSSYWCNSPYFINIEDNGSGGLLAVYYANTGGVRASACTVSGTTFTEGTSFSLYNQVPTSTDGGALVWVPSVSRFFFAMEYASRVKGWLISTSSTSFTNEVGPTNNNNNINTNNTGVIGVLHSAVGMPYIVYADSGTIRFQKVTCTANSISYGSRTDLATSSYWPRITYDPDNEAIVTVYSSGNNANLATGGSNGTCIVTNPNQTTTNLTSENYIGISDAAYSNSATATIQTVGAIDDAQSSLTPGQTYYVQLDGSLGLAPANPSVVAGTAISSTQIIVKG